MVMNIFGKIAEKLGLHISYKKGPSLKNTGSLSVGGPIVVGDYNQIKIENNSPSLTFRMVRPYNFDYRLDGSPFGVMVTSRNSSVNISSVTFVDSDDRAIGKSTVFEIRSSQGELESSYRIDTREDEKKFLETLGSNNGRIVALVKLDDGRTLNYYFSAATDNWKRALGGQKNLEDSFRLDGRELSN